jgi:hypothetical protein
MLRMFNSNHGSLALLLSTLIDFQHEVDSCEDLKAPSKADEDDDQKSKAEKA